MKTLSASAVWQKVTAKFDDKFNILVVLAGVTSTVLMLCQLFLRRGFWMDEISLADNFMFLDFGQLTKALLFGQVAPLGFLFWERAVWLLAENSAYIEYWWRIYPFLCGLGIILLYYPTAYRLTGSKAIALFSYLFLIFMPTFIYYTSEVKQYIGEPFCAVSLLYFWSKTGEKWEWKRVLTMIAVIAFGVFNSLTICFVLLPLGLWDGFELLKKARCRIISMFKSKEFRLYVLQYGAALAFLVIYYFAFLYNHPHTEHMLGCWHFTFATRSNVWNLLDVVFRFFYRDFPVYILVLSVLALSGLKNKFLFFFAITTILTHIGFSSFKLYPLFGRFALYWVTFIPVGLACLLYFPYALCCHFIAKCGYKIKYQTVPLLLGAAMITGVNLFQTTNFPVYVYGHYLKDVFIYINQYYQKEDIVIEQGFDFFPTYYQMYYFKDVDFAHISSLEIYDWKRFIATSLTTELQKYPQVRFWLIVRNSQQEEVETEIKQVLKTFYPSGSVRLQQCANPVPPNTVCLISKAAPEMNANGMMFGN